jgi:rare lipoprotein A
MLCGCSKKPISFSPGQDGAPHPSCIPKHIDRIPNATPKVEPLSRYGNRFKNSNTYVTGKKRYSVMPTSRGYSAQGLASWYGTKFQGRKTSSGEPYDMFSMTAAHRTLPLPTYARVTNVENGKSIIVKVNDRGPFHCNRLIDLSYVAAHKLGIIGRGTGNVKVESIDPRDHHGLIPKHHRHLAKDLKPSVPIKTASKLPLSSTSLVAQANPMSVPSAQATAPAQKLKGQDKSKIAVKKKVYLQLGSFSQKNNAETFAKKLGDFSKLPTYITENMGSGGPRYRVRLGPLKNEQQILTLKQQLAQGQFPTPVVVNEQ